MTCNHKWVKYEPFRGEPYWCCANAGCAVKMNDYLTDRNNSTDPSTEWLAAFDDSATQDGTSLSKGMTTGWVPYTPTSLLPKGDKND